jgi:hypothetical protein
MSLNNEANIVRKVVNKIKEERRKIMILKIRRRIKNIALILAIFSFMMSSKAIILEAKEQVRSCGEAYNLCMSDGPSLTFQYPFLGHLIFCSVGYIFCRKYIEKS